jgi:hypothetical protein
VLLFVHHSAAAEWCTTSAHACPLMRMHRAPQRRSVPRRTANTMRCRKTVEGKCEQARCAALWACAVRFTFVPSQLCSSPACVRLQPEHEDLRRWPQMHVDAALACTRARAQPEHVDAA